MSALLHAGIVNGGAFLAIRMSPIMSQAIAASDALAIIGLVAIAAAELVMPTQTIIQVFLAWTTTAQSCTPLAWAGKAATAAIRITTITLHQRRSRWWIIFDFL